MASISTSNSANHSYSYKANTASGSASSNVGSRQLYEAGDQRNDSQSEIRERQRYKEGKPGSHLTNDSKDDRSIVNRLAREEQRSTKNEKPYDSEAELSKKDPTAPAKLHGNMPSKGAQIDTELQAEDEQRLREKSGK
ncbi:hypothetical protein TMatcc_002833 [Talaromyces marneffei ATCC 18224]|uniref:Uncharacterized protein n=2 Tax=Talaromyces marneffei TaxID=37727 RepID=B6Q7T1_TALMQ|nr:uncharacterized protein EYB26_002081 [Talaromyces marneffei]EEA28816.1 conserved hypothetical protein [Talaromyces marneffei ATCC 18224]KAE8555574.1 hypothetical protein EYB25_000272 [Talaromyces marneffei]QGA14428.1 hypothetical protein EYB26_002081 [Talaromyces marneffei]